jgi:hypothetical protein
VRRFPCHLVVCSCQEHPSLEHEPEYFAAVEHLSDAQLAGFGADDFHQVRVAVSAYGLRTSNPCSFFPFTGPRGSSRLSGPPASLFHVSP